jgi:hypothetical protein
MALRLNGQTTGYTELNAPANGDSVVLTMPGNDGNAGQYLQTNGSGVLSWQTVADTANITQVTYQSLSGTSVVFDSLPADIKRLVIIVWGLSFNGDSDLGIRIGDSGGLETSGYTSSTSYHQNTSYGQRGASDQWRVVSNGASWGYSGFFEIVKNRSDANGWAFAGHTANSANTSVQQAVGYKTLSATLDRVELKPYDVTKSFDAGNAAIMYQI